MYLVLSFPKRCLYAFIIIQPSLERKNALSIERSTIPYVATLQNHIKKGQNNLFLIYNSLLQSVLRNMSLQRPPYISHKTSKAVLVFPAQKLCHRIFIGSIIHRWYRAAFSACLVSQGQSPKHQKIRLLKRNLAQFAKSSRSPAKSSLRIIKAY